MRRRGFSSEWGCAGAADAGCGLRKGLDRAGGCGGGSGSRAAAHAGRKILPSCVGGPRMLRLLRDPVVNAEAFGLQHTKEASRVCLGVGWAALLPSRGTVRAKGEALPPLPLPAVDLPPLKRWEEWQTHRRRRFGGTPTAQGAGTQNRAPTPSATRGPRPQTSAVASLPVEALAERRTSRSRTDAAPPETEAAPTQPQLSHQPHRRSRRSSENPQRRSRRSRRPSRALRRGGRSPRPSR